MGLIKKKTASRGTEGGVKYVCDVCSSDITSTVSLQAHTTTEASLVRDHV
jgi:transcriptional adapter 2-alpha